MVQNCRHYIILMHIPTENFDSVISIGEKKDEGEVRYIYYIHRSFPHCFYFPTVITGTNFHLEMKC